jgi:hypothetical protein
MVKASFCFWVRGIKSIILLLIFLILWGGVQLINYALEICLVSAGRLDNGEVGYLFVFQLNVSMLSSLFS